MEVNNVLEGRLLASFQGFCWRNWGKPRNIWKQLAFWSKFWIWNFPNTGMLPI